MIIKTVFLGALCTTFMAVAADKPFLASLTEVPGASGFEKPVRQLMQQRWQPLMSDMSVDGMGNLIGRFKQNKQGPKVLFMAHMDEVGFMLESITPEGFLKVVPLGGVANSVLYAERWTISTAKGPVLAYSGMDSPHLLGEKKIAASPDSNVMFLDIGAESKEQAEQQFGMRPGLEITPVSEFSQLSDNRYLARALDDRLGLASISDAFDQLKQTAASSQLFAAATVQEEVGLRGADTVSETVHPDVVINVEVGIADDYPGLLAERKGRISLGKGPTVFVYDRSMIPNQELLEWVIDLADKNHIPLQLEVEPGYGEDGAKVQVSGRGVPAVNIGIPIRYAHQHAGVFDKRDYDQAVRLLNLIAQNLNQDVVNRMKSTS